MSHSRVCAKWGWLRQKNCLFVLLAIPGLAPLYGMTNLDTREGKGGGQQSRAEQGRCRDPLPATDLRKALGPSGSVLCPAGVLRLRSQSEQIVQLG